MEKSKKPSKIFLVTTKIKNSMGGVTEKTDIMDTTKLHSKVKDWSIKNNVIEVKIYPK